MINKNKTIAFAGAGLSNSVIARYCSEELGCKCILFETRDHIAGNCYTERHPTTDVMIHKYGPHIFHTDHEPVWKYVNRFCTMMPFVNRVKAAVNSTIYTLPVNLHTINQWFNKDFRPEEAKEFIKSLSDQSIVNPSNFEEQALHTIGKELYHAFFYGYTKKQWGVEPTEISASVLKRLPIRFNYNDNYYEHAFQGIPKDGYTNLIENILDHPNIEVNLSTPLKPSQADNFSHTFWSGPIDAFFNHKFGRLGYRTVFWNEETHEGDWQGTAVINYPDETIPFTRVHEHKHFAPWETHEKTSVYTEYSKETEPGETPYYPLRLKKDMEKMQYYKQAAEALDHMTFVGRLGTYCYLDMDKTIFQSLQIAKNFTSSCQKS